MRIGRPRANPDAPQGDPREVILGVAAALFSSVGYGRTTTRELARAAGLRQASLFHYFARKDDILAELLNRTVDPALQFLRELERSADPPETKLVALVRRDVENLCAGPHNLGALQLLPEARTDRFAEFWDKRAKLRRGYRRIIAAGMASGAFRAAPVDLSTDIVFGLVESTIGWGHERRRGAPARIADAVADAALHLLTPNPRAKVAG